ncbi:hypothetical protein [Pseudoalteromonas sp. T1lg21]|uniref:hypothetical protein n=1 Tax=Pseudoalteromonas sp. T1lg21 TaxID=2077095 RepID=UPI000CF69D3D|nr:hypothetical protein [Pseudoalteromonas sp. T1lg21]
MTDISKNLSLETAFGTKIFLNLNTGIISSHGGAAVYFEKLHFVDDVELIYGIRNGEYCGSFQVLPQEYLKLKSEAKALNLLHKPA